MRPIQVVLVVLLLLISIVFLSRPRSSARNRIMIFILAGVGILMVLMPDLTTTLAHFLGVGRGADLITYFSLIGIIFILLLFYSRPREMDAAITTLVRCIAIAQAHQGGGANKPDSDTSVPMVIEKQ
jgi:hypothetical protein